MGRIITIRIPTVGVQVGAHRYVSMILGFKNQGVFALQFYGQPGCQIDRIESEGRGFVGYCIIHFLLDYSRSMYATGVVPVTMSRIKSKGARG